SPAGLLADRGGARGRLLVGTFLWVVVGYGLAALAPDFWTLAVLLAIAGMGNAAWHPIAASVLARANGQGRAEALGIHAIGGSAAEVLAPLAAGVLLAFVDWRLALALSAVPTVVIGLCFLRVAHAVPSAPRAPAERGDFTQFLRQLRSGPALRLVAMICLYNLALTGLISMVPLYLATTHGLSSTAVGAIFAALMVTGAVLQPWVGRRSDRVGRKPALAIGLLTAAVAGGVLTVPLPFWLMLATMTVAVAALDAIRATMLAATVELSEDREGTTLGLAYVLMDGVGAIGAVLAGFAVSFSWAHMFALTGLLSLAAAGLALGTGRPTPTRGRIATLRARLRLRREWKAILQTAPHLAEDMGLTVAEMEAEVAKRFWQE
ncbi:MAG: MFS transporter, partial [Sphingomonadales bacterium]|nr:MFS transporter [Sphingomonadales bacterium]